HALVRAQRPAGAGRVRAPADEPRPAVGAVVRHDRRRPPAGAAGRRAPVQGPRLVRRGVPDPAGRGAVRVLKSGVCPGNLASSAVDGARSPVSKPETGLQDTRTTPMTPTPAADGPADV